MNKKALAGIIIGGLITLGILGVIYYFFIYKQSTAVAPNPSPSSFFPFGSNSNSNNTSGDGSVNTTGSTPSLVEIPKLRKIWSEPVSGFITFDKKQASTSSTTETYIHFTETATGHIFETKNTSSETTRLSNTTLSKYSDVLFLSPLSFVARRWNNDTSTIETFVGSLVHESTSTDTLVTKGALISPNIKEVVVFGNALFNLYSSVGGSLGYLETPAGGKDVLVFKSALSDWNLDWVSSKLITFETKPSMEDPGYFFVFNTENGSFKSVLGNIYGLTAKASPNLQSLLYSESKNNTILTFYKNTKTEAILQLRSTTLPEKCVWSTKDQNIVYCFVPNTIPQGNYPDDWYKGKVEFSDSLIKIDVSTGSENVLVNLNNESGSDIDAIKPSLNATDGYIYFINKRDGSLWSYDVRP